MKNCSRCNGGQIMHPAEGAVNRQSDFDDIEIVLYGDEAKSKTI